MRETGPVRKQPGDPDSDPDGAAPYVGLARTLLGKLKNHMKHGGLAQLHRAFLLPDGTEIRVSSVHGQDAIRISVPAHTVAANQRAAAALGVRLPQLNLSQLTVAPPQATSLVLVGEANNGDSIDDGYTSALRWGRPNGVPQVLPFQPGLSYIASATAVSNDGGTIAVTAIPDFGQVHGLLYRGSNVLDLGFLPGGFDTYPTGVSADGGIVCGWCNVLGNPQPFVWRRATGMQALPLGGFPAAYAFCISPSGDVIGGEIIVGGNPADSSQTIMAACIWNKGVLSVLAQGVGQFNVCGVTDTGMAVGSVCNGQGVGPQPPTAACYWTPAGELVLLTDYTASGSIAYAVDASGTTIVGCYGGGNSGGQTAENGRASLSPSGGQAALWRNGALTQLSNGLIATAISADGAFVAGLDSTFTYPMLWNSHSGAPTQLLLPPGLDPSQSFALPWAIAQPPTTIPSQTYTVGG